MLQNMLNIWHRQKNRREWRFIILNFIYDYQNWMFKIKVNSIWSPPLRLSRLPEFSCLGPRSCFKFCIFINVDVLTSPERKQRYLPDLWDPAVWHRNLFLRQADSVHCMFDIWGHWAKSLYQSPCQEHKYELSGCAFAHLLLLTLNLGPAILV